MKKQQNRKTEKPNNQKPNNQKTKHPKNRKTRKPKSKTENTKIQMYRVRRPQWLKFPTKKSFAARESTRRCVKQRDHDFLISWHSTCPKQTIIWKVLPFVWKVPTQKMTKITNFAKKIFFLAISDRVRVRVKKESVCVTCKREIWVREMSDGLLSTARCTRGYLLTYYWSSHTQKSYSTDEWPCMLFFQEDIASQKTHTTWIFVSFIVN